MFERWKTFLSQGQPPEVPTYREQGVEDSYRALLFQMKQAEDAKQDPDFNQREHAQRIKVRVRNLRDSASKAEEVNSFYKVPEYILANSADRTYFYETASDKLIQTDIEVISKGMGGLLGYKIIPKLTYRTEMPDEFWCLNVPLVWSLARNIVSNLPQTAARRIQSIKDF